MQILGNKYQIYEDGVLKVRRVVKHHGTSEYVLKEKGIDTKFIVSEKDLSEKYVKLTPDAFLNIMITKEPTYEGQEVEDVYFCVNRAGDYANGNSVPALLLRQNCYSFLNNIYATDGKIYIGECSTIVNSSKEDIAELMQFEEIKKQHSIAVYIDDSAEDMLACIPNKFKKDINNTLCAIKNAMQATCVGTTETIEELWENNDFIGNYKSIFNITQIDFPIIIGKQSYNDNGDIVLNEKQKNRLQDMLKRYISNIRVIKYDKDIDISKVVNVQHVVVCDANNNIFLIAYNVDGYYADSEADAQVLQSMGMLAPGC